MRKTTCITKKIASVALTLALVLPAFVGVKTSSAAEADATTALLKEYAGKITFLGANPEKTYDGMLEKKTDDGQFEYSVKDVPTDPIGYRIDDFDQDGANELLVMEQYADHCGKLVMYEVVDSQVTKKAELELVEFQSDDYKECYKNGLGWSYGDSSCFVYVQNGKKYIGIEAYNVANYTADGFGWSFFRVAYDGTSLSEDSKYVCNGSDLNMYDVAIDIYDALNLTTDMETVKKDGFRVRDFVTSKIEFAGSKIADENVEYEKREAMKTGDQIKASTISFYMANNIAAETEKLTDIGNGSAKNIAPGKVTLKSAKAKSGKLVVNWKETAKCQGYQIEVNGKKKNLGAWNNRYALKVKKGKKYSVRIRAFAEIGGKKAYGKWSAKKTVKAK